MKAPMNSTVRALFAKYRRPQWVAPGFNHKGFIYQTPAEMALRHARASDEWQRLEFDDKVRMEIEPDYDMTFEDFEGDCYNPQANPDISPARLERDRKEARERLARVGFCQATAQYRDHKGEWQTADSIGGIEGDDIDDIGGYRYELMLSAIAEYHNAQRFGFELVKAQAIAKAIAPQIVKTVANVIAEELAKEAIRSDS